MIKHIWKYLTSPLYRGLVDLPLEVKVRKGYKPWREREGIGFDGETDFALSATTQPAKPQKVKPKPNQY